MSGAAGRPELVGYNSQKHWSRTLRDYLAK